MQKIYLYIYINLNLIHYEQKCTYFRYCRHHCLLPTGLVSLRIFISGNDHGRRITSWYFSWLFIYAVIFVRWAHMTNFKAGFRGGLTLGLLYALTWHSFAYNGDIAYVDVIKDVLVGALMAAIGAGAIGFVHGKIS